MATISKPESGLFYTDSGQGAVCLLIAGFNADHSCWQPVLDALQLTRRVIAFDHRGIGKSAASAAFGWQTLVADVLALLDQLDIDRAQFVGHSMGAKIALEIAAHHPDRVDRLLLMNPQAQPIDFPLTDVLKIAGELAALGVPNDLILRNAGLWGYGSGFCRSGLPYKQELAHSARVGATLSAEGFEAQRQLLLTDQSDLLSRIQAPTLVVTGSDDRLLLPKQAEFIAQKIADARFQVIDHCAHIPQLDQPAELIRIMQAFLD